STPTTVEIFHKGSRIASHVRDRRRGHAITQTDPRPKSHQAHLEWPPSLMVNWARSIGPNTVRANPKREAAPGDGLPLLPRHHSPGAAVLSATHGSRGGTGTPRPGLSLSEREVDLEELARRGSLISAATRLPTSDPRQCTRRRLLRPRRPDLMLNQPMMEKLLVMRLQGMVEGLKVQEQDRAINDLSFLERFALLVDQQWSWRENQALARRLKAGTLRGPAG